MKAYYLIVVLFFNLIVTAQKPRIEKTEKYKDFENISFILFQNTIDVEGVFIGDAKKEIPLIVFIGGSGSRPLYALLKDSSYYQFTPTPSASFNDTTKYNYVYLSKPGIPIAVHIDSLSDDYNYRTVETIKNNIAYNNLEFNIQTYTNLLETIDGLCSYTNIIVMGHSQGARIAAELSLNDKVSKVVYMSADPLGRMATQYDVEYAKFETRNEEKLAFYDSLSNDQLKDSIFWGDSFYSWKSFSKPSIIALSQSEIPILIVYGDLDKNCPNCYVFSGLPNYCENIKTIKYTGYNHNYYDSNGDKNWEKVLNDIYLWLDND